jgi:hypothetical protein
VAAWKKAGNDFGFRPLLLQHDCGLFDQIPFLDIVNFAEKSHYHDVP